MSKFTTRFQISMVFIVSIFLSLTSPQPANAYFSTMDTADILPEGHFNLAPELQFITNPNSGVNMGTRFDGSISDELGYRGMIGFGETTFHIGGFTKWVPIPDIDNQPGIGVLGGITFGRYDEINELSIRIHPIISKKFGFDWGSITPYGSLPFGITARDKKTVAPLQLVAGGVYSPGGLDKVSFGGEIGFDVSKAYSYFSLYLNMIIDEDGFEFR